MPAHKKYFTEEEKLESQRESYRKYNNSDKGKKRKEDFLEDYVPDKEKQREYTNRYRQSMTEEERECQLEKQRTAMKKSRRDNLERHMTNDARKRAKQKGIEFSITSEDIFIPEYCPVLGLELFIGDGKRSPNSPSLDRIDNTKGYTPDNIMVISTRANQLKNDATVEELRAIVKYMEVHLGLVCD